MRNSESQRKKDLKERTKEFALRIIRLSASLPRSREADIIGRQMVGSGTSVGSNYREATRSRSKAEFISKIGIVKQEADETLYWLELLEESEIMNPEFLADLVTEAENLVRFAHNWNNGIVE